MAMEQSLFPNRSDSFSDKSDSSHFDEFGDSDDDDGCQPQQHIPFDLTPQQDIKWDPVWENLKHVMLGNRKLRFCEPLLGIAHHPSIPRARTATAGSVEDYTEREKDGLLELIEPEEEEEEEGFVIEEYLEKRTSYLSFLVEHALVALCVLFVGFHLLKHFGLEFQVVEVDMQ